MCVCAHIYSYSFVCGFDTNAHTHTHTRKINKYNIRALKIININSFYFGSLLYYYFLFDLEYNEDDDVIIENIFFLKY